jgi:hypothetical protein
MCNVPLYIKNEVYNLTRTRVGRYTHSMQIKFQEDCNEQKNMHTIKHRFITVFTRTCHWPVSWDGWIQSKPLHSISQVNANALEYIKLCTLFERWYHLDLWVCAFILILSFCFGCCLSLGSSWRSQLLCHVQFYLTARTVLNRCAKAINVVCLYVDIKQS